MAGFEILIVCTGNICRSPMAEGLLKHKLPACLRRRVSVTSAGTQALHGNQPVSHAVNVMAQYGINISGHRARQVNREMLSYADLALGMEKSHVQQLRKIRLWHRSPIRLLSEFDPRNQTQDPQDIEDPYGGPLELYQECLDILQPCIDGVVQWLAANENLAPKDHPDA